MNKYMTWLTMMVLWLLALAAHAGTKHYYYTDPQGTPLAKADVSGAIIATYDYAPYGQAVASMSGSPDGPGYTGHVNDPGTGLVYMQARYYDPGAGRFLSVDQVGPAAGNVSNFNRYGYAKNNPIVNIDPDGRDPKTRQEATKLATDLNRTSSGGSSGFWAVVQTGSGRNDFTVQSSDQTAMERGGFTQQAEQGYQPGTACPQLCAAIAVSTAVAVGDISDDPSAGTINKAREANNIAEKVLKIAESAPVSDVVDMAKGLGTATKALRPILAIPATHNIYKQCMEECPKSYQDRSGTTKKREQ